jgi:hypothetical protein
MGRFEKSLTLRDTIVCDEVRLLPANRQSRTRLFPVVWHRLQESPTGQQFPCQSSRFFPKSGLATLLPAMFRALSVVCPVAVRQDPFDFSEGEHTQIEQAFVGCFDPFKQPRFRVNPNRRAGISEDGEWSKTEMRTHKAR